MAVEEKRERKSGISRREFLKDAGFAVGGIAVSSTVLGVACAPKEVIKEVQVPGKEVIKEVPGPTKTVEVTKALEGVVTLTVNNQKFVVKIEPEWSLAFVLRDKLGLVGLKVGCDRGECGSCTIIVDGRTYLACNILAADAEGYNIRTIEGLANGPTLHPVQKLFLENQTFQCGFCTGGMIMSAVVLLGKTPKPALDQVREALSGNLCYCCDYARQVNTILKGV